MRKEKQQIQAGVTLSAVQQVKTNFAAQPAVIRHTLFIKKNSWGKTPMDWQLHNLGGNLEMNCGETSNCWHRMALYRCLWANMIFYQYVTKRLNLPSTISMGSLAPPWANISRRYRSPISLRKKPRWKTGREEKEIRLQTPVFTCQPLHHCCCHWEPRAKSAKLSVNNRQVIKTTEIWQLQVLPRRGKGGQGDRRTERETKRSETAAGLNAMLIRLTVGFPQQNLIALLVQGQML